MINEIVTRTETSIETRRLKIVVVILTIYLAVEIVAGYITGSLALIADALAHVCRCLRNFTCSCGFHI